MGTIGIGKKQGQSRLGECKAGLEATKHPTVRDIMWASGIFEGEGNCTDHNAGISVGQKDRWLPDRLRTLFGGSVGEHHVHRGDQHFTHFTWKACGARGRGFLMIIYQFMSPKRQMEIKHYLAA